VTLLLKHEDVVDLLTLDETIAAVRAGFVEQAAGEVQVPPRTTTDAASGHGWLRLMPAILNGSGLMGYKAMHSTPGVGVRYLVALYDLKTGELLAQMDADWLTSRRTAATAAVATDVLARPTLTQVGLLGSSEQARALLSALSRVRKLPRVEVFSPTPANRAAFADEMGARLEVEIQPVASAEAAVRDSDLVACAVRAGAAPVLFAEWLAPGAHVTAISAVRPEARELDAPVWSRAAVRAVDDRGHVLESGDGRAALASGVVRPDDLAELWELIGGQRAGRQDPDDVTVFKSVGTALQDLSLAAAIYRRAREQGRGVELGDFPHPRR
jgi:ornithine cyclodeaminase/alanine dehydrogenase-like protein (mu-crystallin family)